MDERLEELFPFFALGALTDEERTQIDAYVAADADAGARLNEAIRAAAALPYTARPIAPRSQTKQAVLSRVKADAPARFASARVRSPRKWRGCSIALPGELLCRSSPSRV